MDSTKDQANGEDSHMFAVQPVRQCCCKRGSINITACKEQDELTLRRGAGCALRT